MINLKSLVGCAVIASGALVSCNSAAPEAEGLKSGLNPADFDTVINKKQVKLYTLRNANGMEVDITNFGGRVVSIMAPDKDGNFQDVVLGYDNVAQYADSYYAAVFSRGSIILHYGLAFQTVCAACGGMESS